MSPPRCFRSYRMRRSPRPRFAAHARYAVLLTTLLAAWLSAGSVVRSAGAPGIGFWHAVGPQLYDAAGNPVRIAGVTWYGMETANWVPAGLDTQPYTAILDQVKLLGYNVVRLPLSNELVEQNPVVVRAVRANPQFLGKHALVVLDALVGYAGSIGLKVLLDNHRSHASRPLEINTLNEPLWYTKAYPQSAWLHDWQTLALRYRGNDTVIGFDLRNEPHTVGPGPWNIHAYLTQGATWGPYRGRSNPATDWRSAAQLAGNAILAIDPGALIVVEGVSLYPDATAPLAVNSSWWAGILTPALKYPVVLHVPGKLVYSVHDYGPRKASMPWFTPLTYESLDKAYRHNWAFVPGGAATPVAPLLLGEFGTCTSDPVCTDNQAPGNQATWFQLLLRWLRVHPQVGWSFFALNGTNANRCATDNGLLNPQWNGVASVALQGNLASAQSLPGFVPKDSGPLVPNSSPVQAPRASTAALCQLP